ncbi:hypothetical protein D3C75_517410 [compost metagenome]
MPTDVKVADRHVGSKDSHGTTRIALYQVSRSAQDRDARAEQTPTHCTQPITQLISQCVHVGHTGPE